MTHIILIDTIFVGWTGHGCVKDLNECNLVKTICNTGTCTNTPGSYHCSCPLGTYGKQCEILETCDSHPVKIEVLVKVIIKPSLVNVNMDSQDKNVKHDQTKKQHQ